MQARDGVDDNDFGRLLVGRFGGAQLQFVGLAVPKAGEAIHPAERVGLFCKLHAAKVGPCRPPAILSRERNLAG